MVEVTLENITHSYDGETNAVENINITFANRSANSLLGPSGCGKTTLLKIITGLLTPTKGRVYFDDQDVTEQTPERRNVAMVFQFPVVYSMTVLENLMFPLLNVKEMTKEEKREKALTAAEILGLTPILNERAPTLGPADRQRTALGRALVRKPNIFLFDEPLSSIEPDQRSLLKTKIKETQQELQQTSVYVTHDQTEALTFAEKVAVMDVGRVAQYDTVENIYEKPSSTFVAFFVGFPGMNILEGTLKENKILLKDFDVEIPEKTRLPKSLTEVKVGIRPEHIEISTEKKRGWIPFQSELFENLGKGFGVLHLATKNHRITARSTFSVPPGSDVWVNFPTNYLHLFDPEGKRLDT